jgi:protein phosphatase 2C
VHCNTSVLLLQARVSDLGGKVVTKGGSSRVMGLLAMTRAIGDHFLRPYVIPEPEVRQMLLLGEDAARCLVVLIMRVWWVGK